MPRITDARMRMIVTASAIGAVLLLVSCDQRDERIERARELGSVAMDQISGRQIEKSSPRGALESASVADRAISGVLRNDINVQVASAQSRFAIGSIIAKPKDIPPAPTALSYEELDELEAMSALEGMVDEDGGVESAPAPEFSMDPEEMLAQPVDAMPVIELDPTAPAQTRESIQRAEREMRTRSVVGVRPVPRLPVPGVAPPPQLPGKPRSLPQPGPDVDQLKDRKIIVPRIPRSLPPAKRHAVKRAIRRAVITEQAIARQTEAQSVMLDRMSKFGLGGEVALSRSGQMVIQIGADGADPTFMPQDADGASLGDPTLPKIATAAADGCPDPEAITPEQFKADPVLATECFVEDLRRTGQFEYVEMDFIFENQMIRRQPPEPGPGEGSDTNTDTGETPGSLPTPTVVNVVPNDPLWGLQWHFQNNGSDEGQSAGGASFQDFWTKQGLQGSDEVVVAIVDTGLQMSHPDILNSPNLVPGWDMVSDPTMGNDGDGRDNDPNDPGDMCDPNEPYAADSFHGTHVAGTVGAAATNNGAGVAGGAWNVKIVPVRALGKCGGRLSDINDAIRWAAGTIPADDVDGNEIYNENPADIINLSIGLFNYCPASLQEAIDEVTARGAIVVAAAGNARVETRFYAPAGCNNVITVAAGDARGQITPYSNYGTEVDILAPGGDLFRDDNGDGRPDGILSTKHASNCYDPVTGEGVDSCFYAYEQGTSMAAPHVSAALALLKARDPDASAIELEAQLLNSLDPRNALQCAGLCADYPGATPIEGTADMCVRPCGGGLLNLENIAALDAAPE